MIRNRLIPAIIIGLIACSCANKGAANAAPRAGDTIDALAVVRELAKPEYEGRQAGSPGGRKAGDYLRKTLEGIGFTVVEQAFPERPPVLVRKPRFAVAVPGSPTRELEFRKDYRESASGAWTGERAEGKLAFLAHVNGDFPKGAVVVLSGRTYDAANDETLRGRGASALILLVDPEMAEKRATYPGNDSGELAQARTGFIKMVVSSDLADYLAEAAAKGAVATLENPLGFEDRSCRNFVASWNGDDGAFEPRVMLLAHYDHVGLEWDGTPFPGAFDNASGVALVLSLAENFVRDGVKTDVAFLLTDAEEVNLSGAAAFAEAPPFPLDGVNAINLDMVGGKGPTTPSLYSNGGESALLADKVRAALAKAGVKANPESPVYNVDSGPLGFAGARAVTICEYDTDAYHTKRDVADGVLAADLAVLEDAVYGLAKELAKQ